MIIGEMADAVISGRPAMGASRFLEDADLPMHSLHLGIGDGAAPIHKPVAAALVAASFALGTMREEGDVSVEGDPIPMLIAGSRPLHARWAEWNGIPGPAFATEAEEKSFLFPCGIDRCARKNCGRVCARGYLSGCGICE